MSSDIVRVKGGTKNEKPGIRPGSHEGQYRSMSLRAFFFLAAAQHVYQCRIADEITTDNNN